MRLQTIPLPQSGKDIVVATTRGTERGIPQVRSGYPLHVAWRTLYAGDLPNKFLGGNKTVILSSYAKSTAYSDAAPRVINAVYDDLKDRTERHPEAKQSGPSTLHYEPSVASDVNVDLELIAKKGDGRDLRKIQGLLEKGVSSPLLVFATGWLAAAGKGFAIAGDIARAVGRDMSLLDTSFVFACSDQIDPIREPQSFLAAENPRQLYEGRHIAYGAKATGGFPYLANANGNAYNGDAPYVIFEIDQNERPALSDYTNELAASQLLAGWTPNEGVDIGKLMDVIGAGVKKLRIGSGGSTA